MNRKELQLVVENHQRWLSDPKSGKKAVLQDANLCNVNLRGIHLQYANLRHANLWDTNLRDANLRYTDLRDADLQYANLRDANLQVADLRDADLQYANLQYADLRRADLRGADLWNVNLWGADLQSCQLNGAILPHFQVCPTEGEFIAWKTVKGGAIKLLIPADARRTSSLVSRKCRAEYIKVLEGSGVSMGGIRYVEGKTYCPVSYNDDIRLEDANGIHFFITKKEAEAGK